MRVTQNVTYNTYLNDIMQKQESIFNLNQQLATGRSVNAPSDNAVAASEILRSRSAISTIAQYGKNIDSSLGYLSQGENALNGVKDVLTSIREIAATSNSGTSDAAARQQNATVVQDLFDQLRSLANTNYDNKSIFAGYKTDLVPFDASGIYSGDTNKYSVKINANSSITVGINGGDVFKGASGGVDIMSTVATLVSDLQSNNTTGIQSAIGNLDTAFSQVSGAVADLGGKVTRLTAAQSEMQSNTTSLRSSLSNIEDADITKIISELQLNQTALQAAIQSAGKVFSINIFNYL